MEDNSLPTLVVLVGFPRAGKSTVTREFYIPAGYSVVAPDMIRRVIHGRSFVQALEHFVWAIVYAMADALLASGNRVVVDGTHISHRRRSHWVERGAVFHHLDTPYDVCLKRAQTQSNACDIVPVITRMAKEFEPLSLDYGELSWAPSAEEPALTGTP